MGVRESGCGVTRHATHSVSPATHAQIVPPGTMVTRDYRTNRVRIYVDAAGKVERTPKTG